MAQPFEIGAFEGVSLSQAERARRAKEQGNRISLWLLTGFLVIWLCWMVFVGWYLLNLPVPADYPTPAPSYTEEASARTAAPFLFCYN